MSDIETMVRQDDHDTSIKAAFNVALKISAMMRAVYAVHLRHPDGLTDSELRKIMVSQGWPDGGESTYRKRRTDLCKDGYEFLGWNGDRRLNENGNLEKVWKITGKPLPPGTETADQ